MTTIGIIGAGNIGGQLARLALANGYDVVLSNSRGPETLTGLVAELGTAVSGQSGNRPTVRAATAEGAGEAGDLVVVTIPLKNYRDVPVAPLAGKVVIDTNNYYPERDGRIPELDDESTTTAELSQRHLPTSKVVKAFNNIMAADLTEEGTPAGTANRRTLPIAGDDEDAKATVAALVERFGFDVVDAGPLSEGWRFQRDTPAYVVRQNSDELTGNLAAARRYRDM
ncbi:NADPH-dependent F420 reductase [Jatrophihabitans lederbergiae]|uniref:NAD(P)-binding domain-containing protein n=1 Tax=Jatrophihabitans lederbergiae TaxID=3075547 RepID=A0ABU2JAB0_9ACTN|nr:NAD(P)-binding domain-containing protein [Jatrophihabitans sp. DSM 44399]MDT0261930.1 NAD(P)-binding domain-containing protein [Jatrophihabitans sp. DSM 44399]